MEGNPESKPESKHFIVYYDDDDDDFGDGDYDDLDDNYDANIKLLD